MANIASIVQELRQERGRLDEAIRALEGVSNSAGGGTRRTGRRISAAGRRRIAAAQRARWAKIRGSSKPRKVRVISQAARNKMAAAQRVRWAKVRGQAKKAA